VNGEEKKSFFSGKKKEKELILPLELMLTTLMKKKYFSTVDGLQHIHFVDYRRVPMRTFLLSFITAKSFL
jgi:hypothetical protein